MTVAAAKKQEIIERRMQISQLRLSGFHRQDKIAEQLGVSRATINRDFKVLDEMYMERSATNIAIAKGIDLERVDALIFAIWVRAKAGNLAAIEEVRQLLATRAKLLGLDAPKQQWISGPEGKPIPWQEEVVDFTNLSEDKLRQYLEVVGALIEAQEITSPKPS